MLWQKFRGQFVYLLVSFILILLTYSVYGDVYNILKISNKENLWVLVLTKYSILIVIILLNIRHFKSIKTTKLSSHKKTPRKTILEPVEEEMMKKPLLNSKTDLILKKYKSR